MKGGDAQKRSPRVTLLSAPLQLGGEWGGSPLNDAFAVISLMREACLSGVRLLSDPQPAKLRVDDQTSGPPHIWLHDENPDTAWIVVDVGALDWCKLSYQFGHELGHVLCNSWQPQAKPKLPSQWLEEALVEAFSIRGLGLLADSWEQRPPFPNNAAFASNIRKSARPDRKIPEAGTSTVTGALPMELKDSWGLFTRIHLSHKGALN